MYLITTKAVIVKHSLQFIHQFFKKKTLHMSNIKFFKNICFYTHELSLIKNSLYPCEKTPDRRSFC